MCKQNRRKSLRMAIEILGEQVVIKTIVGRHKAELSSPTRKVELERQLGDKGAGPLAHLMGCDGCSNVIIAQAESKPAFNIPFSISSASVSATA